MVIEVEKGFNKKKANIHMGTLKAEVGKGSRKH